MSILSFVSNWIVDVRRKNVWFRNGSFDVIDNKLWLKITTKMINNFLYIFFFSNSTFYFDFGFSFLLFWNNHFSFLEPQWTSSPPRPPSPSQSQTSFDTLTCKHHMQNDNHIFKEFILIKLCVFVLIRMDVIWENVYWIIICFGLGLCFWILLLYLSKMFSALFSLMFFPSFRKSTRNRLWIFICILNRK